MCEQTIREKIFEGLRWFSPLHKTILQFRQNYRAFPSSKTKKRKHISNKENEICSNVGINEVKNQVYYFFTRARTSSFTAFWFFGIRAASLFSQTNSIRRKLFRSSQTFQLEFNIFSPVLGQNFKPYYQITNSCFHTFLTEVVGRIC